MTRKSYKVIAVMTLVIILMVFIVYFIAANSIKKTQLTITFNNISQVTVNDDNGKEMGSSTNSPYILNLDKYSNYTAEFTPANDDYSEGKKVFYVGGDDKKVTIDPYYSRKKLNSILSQDDIKAINKEIINFSPSVKDNFSINLGQLYEFGDWYGTVLAYKGVDYFNNDNLRVILNKENNTWKMVGSPSISLDKHNHSPASVETIESINTQ